MARRLATTCRLAAAGLALGVALAGCDTIYGVRREAVLPDWPDADCVALVLGSTPEIARVQRHEPSPPGTVLTSAGFVKPAGAVTSFFYMGPEPILVWSNLTVGPAGAYGRPIFSQSMGSFGGPPPQAVVDAVRPVMQAVEQRVGAACGRPELPAAVVETCSKGLVCGPIARPAPPASGASAP